MEGSESTSTHSVGVAAAAAASGGLGAGLGAARGLEGEVADELCSTVVNDAVGKKADPVAGGGDDAA